MPGEPVTVKYTGNGYYYRNCQCATCHPERPPIAPKQTTSAVPVLLTDSKRHRSGRKHHRAKKRGAVENFDQQAQNLKYLEKGL
jgi:hypothetical protein